MRREGELHGRGVGRKIVLKIIVWEGVLMAIDFIKQPSFISVTSKIRLRKYDGQADFALIWYQDKETVLLVDGNDEPYSVERLKRMYTYLDNHGELYFIEYLVNESYVEIGDVTFSKEDMPIVIGDKEYRGLGIGKEVLLKLIERGNDLGYRDLFVREIYDYNVGSQRLFESVGFRKYEKTEKGYSYRLKLNEK